MIEPEICFAELVDDMALAVSNDPKRDRIDVMEWDDMAWCAAHTSCYRNYLPCRYRSSGALCLFK